MLKAECIHCFHEWESGDDVMIHEVVNCPDCNVDMEVIAIENGTLKFQALSETKEDWGE